MEVQFVCPEGSDLTQLEKAYPDLYHDDTYDGWSTYWIGVSGERYWDAERQCYNYGDDDDDAADFSDDRVDSKEWMTEAAAEEFCGFAETLIEGSHTLLEGNGSWAQGQMRKGENYRKGVVRAKEVITVEPIKTREVVES